MNKAKKIFEKLKLDHKSVLLTAETITNNLFKNLKISNYSKDKELANLIVNLEKIDDLYKEQRDVIPISLGFLETREIDRSTLYRFDSLFQLLHADVANLEFLGKSAVYPKYCLS